MDYLQMAKEYLFKAILSYGPNVVLAIVVLIVGFWLAKKVTQIVRVTLGKRGFDKDLIPFLSSIINSLLKVMIIISVMGIVGIETTSFVAVLAAMGFAIGMALQGSLGNFAGGVLILLFKPFRSGDLISTQGFTGVVKEVQIFTTSLLTPDNKLIILPNGPLSNSPITNISGQGTIRVDMVFGIGYSDDIDKARTIIKQVSDSCPEALKDMDTDILVTELADSSVNFAVRVWTKSEHYWDVYFFMHEAIKKAFDEQKISIPFPQMDVHQHTA